MNCGYLIPKYERKGLMVKCFQNRNDVYLSLFPVVPERRYKPELTIEQKPNLEINFCKSNDEIDVHADMLVLRSKEDEACDRLKKIGCQDLGTHHHNVVDSHLHFWCGKHTNKKIDEIVDIFKDSWSDTEAVKFAEKEIEEDLRDREHYYLKRYGMTEAEYKANKKQKK